ncbi:MAG: hypothetical protein WKF58_02965 [Ilumatobacteraceae bacterium]
MNVAPVQTVGTQPAAAHRPQNGIARRDPVGLHARRRLLGEPAGEVR